MNKPAVAICWLRRDLRLNDQAALYHALKSGHRVLPVFIFDTEILNRLEEKHDRRLAFIHSALHTLQKQLLALGSTLDARHGEPIQVWKQLLDEYDVKAVYVNRDYEPYSEARDQAVAKLLHGRGIPFFSSKDQCIFEKSEVVKDDGKPYTVFTPYSKKWRAKFDGSSFFSKGYPNEKYFAAFANMTAKPIPSLESMGFARDEGWAFPSTDIAVSLLRQYGDRRDLPAVQGTSRMSVHLRFGTVSIREMARLGLAHSEKWLNELIWRDFYMMILHHFPHVTESAFKPAYDYIDWRNNEDEFAAWCEGRTGYPIVDAGMRELNATGFMHNRVRMVVASFLTKHLLIDWRWGEAYFAKKLLDFELSSNNGGWQWAAGSGCDAAPYFRVFNPSAQADKFDKDNAYIKKWVPEFQSKHYPKPIVDHAFARQRALDTYKAGLARVAPIPD